MKELNNMPEEEIINIAPLTPPEEPVAQAGEAIPDIEKYIQRGMVINAISSRVFGSGQKGWKLYPDGRAEGVFIPNRLYYSTQFDSTDGLTLTTGVDHTSLALRLDTGLTSGTTRRAFLAPFTINGANFNRKSEFAVLASFNSQDSPVTTNTNQTGYIVVGDNPTATANKAYGFRITNNDIEAFHDDGTTETVTSLGLSPGRIRHYMVSFEPAQRILFFVDGTLKAIHTTNLPSGTENVLWVAQITNNAAEQKFMYIHYLTYIEDLS